MNKHFNINYEFDRETIWKKIDEQLQQESARFVCVADGNVMQMVYKDINYRNIVNGSMFSICDSSWAPVFLNRLYKTSYNQYCGSQIFEDLTGMKKYRQFFIGTSDKVLSGLKNELSKKDHAISEMSFFAPPFCKVEDFDYQAIAELINNDNPDIIWVALGAPKQEQFMYRLQPLLKRGVMIGVGAVFNFYCGLKNTPKRAPQWMVKSHLEFVYRIFSEPRKQLKRCKDIVLAFPSIYREEKQLINHY